MFSAPCALNTIQFVDRVSVDLRMQGMPRHLQGLVDLREDAHPPAG
jgi:hypothetical protein